MVTQQFSLEELKRTDMVDYLEKLGYRPSKIIRSDHWYSSPFRAEKTPSFKVNRKQNCWFDFGEGVGGNLVDFCLKYYRCSIKELFDKVPLGFLQPVNISQTVPVQLSGSSRITVLDVLPITNPALVQYLNTRRISLELARQFCSEVHYQLRQKNYFAIGFQNDQGGYELRNKYFKGSSSPKSSRFINYHSTHLLVFEGFFSFLAYQQLEKHFPPELPNYLILNSLSFFDKQRTVMERHEHIDLYLDRDNAGVAATIKALQWSNQYSDASCLYAGYKDAGALVQAGRHVP